MRYAITGATGFVGGAVAGRLLGAGNEVFALVRRPERAGSLAERGVTLVVGDLDDHHALDALCDQRDGLFHVAGWYRLGDRDSDAGERVNVDGTRNVLGAARRAGTARVVYTSTLAVNSDTGGRTFDERYRFTGRHLSVYDETKARAHHIAKRFGDEGLPVVTVMPGLVYGPDDTSQTGALLFRVIEGSRPMVARGGGNCWGYVDDIAAGHVLAMERGVPGESYMLAGPEATLAEGLQMAAEIAGTKGPIIIPTGAVRALAVTAGGIGRLVPLPPLYAAETLRASLATYLGDPRRAQIELGWWCRPMREGLTALVESILGKPTGP
ncbi:MAG: NAD-dependent epimerase/dehydratase family protein [Acidimicrobiia bacterium]